MLVGMSSIDELPERPLLLVANEFLDALPIRQHIAGVERRIKSAAGGLTFDRDGDIVETSPARDQAVAAIATCLEARGGVAFFVDYGHAKPRPATPFRQSTATASRPCSPTRGNKT